MKKRQAASALLVLSLLLGGCAGNTKEYEAEIRQLREENNALTQQVAELQDQLEQLKYTRLESWDLEARGTGEDSPATVALTVCPAAHEEGMGAELLVTLEGSEVTRVPCTWDGDVYRAEVTLDPVDGYGYYCVLTTLEGTREQVSLSTPDHPVMPKPVYLKSSLSAYVSALVSNQRQDKGRVTADLTVSLQLPLLTADGNPVTAEACRALWMLDGETLEEIPLELAEGETEQSLSVFAQGLAVNCPELEEGSTLRLTVSAVLSDGRVLTAEAASWTGAEDGFYSAVG